MSQVKEKFGELSFYMSQTTDAIGDAIDDATKESRSTCETYGEPGTKNDDNGWIRVICDPCEAEDLRRSQIRAG
jgi:hypothetical protein